MAVRDQIILPRAFKSLAWSNLAAQSAEQVGLAATPLLAVFAFGTGAGAMARRAGAPSAGSPASVPVHDDAKV